MEYNVLFDGKKPISPLIISDSIYDFRESYTQTTRYIIKNTDDLIIDKKIFIQNSALLLNKFGMARSGPFKGIGINSTGHVKGPIDRLEDCWTAVKIDLVFLRKFLNEKKLEPRSRTLILLDNNSMEQVIKKVWFAFKKLLPLTMGKHSYGLVGASKILYSVLPEIILPIDNSEWLTLFKTVDLKDVIVTMTNEIIRWEQMTGDQLQNCDHSDYTTLPAVYNVMALKARKGKFGMPTKL
jgi:hypothetical protein